MDALFRLCLLGMPQATVNGKLVREFESRKALALLAYLAVRDEPLARTHLADLFWGTLPEAKGRGNLSRVLHNLNELFPDTFHASRDWIQIDLTAFAVDLCDFEAHAMAGTADSLAAAAALYHDEFMAGLYLDDCPEFEVWLVAERERWRQRIVSVLECLSGYYARRGKYETALPFTARLLYIEPWREETHRDMMRLLAQTGQRSAALQQYETARRVLAEELNVEPSAETNALYEQIRAEEIAPHNSPPHNLPAHLTTFFGRETELTRIAARLNNPACRLLTLVGAGGIGKTRLALEAGNNLLNSFRDGVFFVPLASIGAGQAEFIVPAIANALGFTFAGSDEPKTQLLNFLRAKNILLLLDNFEHLLNPTKGLDSAGLVLEILQHAPKVKILVTSREPLNVQAEWITRVEGLSYPTNVSPNAGELEHYSAVQLFVERASRVNENFSLDAVVSASIIRICQIVEGMPLALELTAAATQSLAVNEIAEQVGQNLDVMTTAMRDVETRHHSLRAVLDWSYALLSEAEQTFFRRASVFAGGWTLEAAEAVCVGENAKENHVARVLTKLADKSLVLKEEREGETRYRMLEPVRQYAQEKLQPQEGHALQAHHLEYFLQLAVVAEPKLKTREQWVWLSRLETEIHNLRVALSWAEETGAIESGLMIIGTLGVFWLRRGYVIEIYDSLEKLLAMPNKRKETMGRANALLATSYFADAIRTRTTIQQTRFQEALAIFRKLGDQPGIVDSLVGLADLAIRVGDLAEAQLFLEESLALSQALGDPLRIAYTLESMGTLAYKGSDHHRSRLLRKESLRIYREIGDWQSMAWLLNHLGEDALWHGDYGTANTLLEELVDTAREFGEKRTVALGLLNLGNVALHQGDYATARTLGEASQTLREELGGDWADQLCLLLLGMTVLHEQGDVVRAKQLIERALQIAGDKSELPIGVYYLGHVALHQSDYCGAARLFQESLAIYRNKLQALLSLEGLASVAAHPNKSEANLERAKRSARLFGATEALRESSEWPIPKYLYSEYEVAVTMLREQIADKVFSVAWAEGRAMTMEQAIAYALEDADTSNVPT